MKVISGRLDRAFELHQKEYEDKAIEVLRSGWYILGKEVSSFEEEFAAHNNIEYCVGVASGLDALALAIRALGIGEGDEVLVQANTYIASVMGITMNRATPVFVEANKYYNISVEDLESKITPKTKAIMVVHLYGQACKMDVVMEVAKKHGLYVVEDCAQSHDACYNGKKTGTFGDIGCFSFYPTKNLGAFGDAGAILTSNKELRDKIAMLRNYGSKVKYHFEEVGLNSRLDELQAGLLRVRLRYLEAMAKERERIADYYTKNIKNDKIIKPELQEGATSVWHQYVVRTDERDRFEEYLKENEIITTIHYPIPPHLSKAYEYLNLKEGSFPMTEKYAKEMLSLPIYNGMTDEEVKYVVEVINKY
ncbi:DegT/DnrJ/EryC1/StrS aminotransferase family protein [Lachnoanaerobaculum sp. ICM7]|jgi:possible aminotransferase|uniref:DegT/DnrJ/EryC1/StrS family aminotransferase n=1 Tax=Lachnoanaerobaculum sp. ICM7 TaxID=936594 RepID=UPI00027A552F|nr:DegT/DnrJ/EryC1/StrS family aminotransferase [Lachnoanaerobaculum sp. ICM7]EJP18952.1 DegT/DnrJ/EryC1/StrS aminotransferase family protein [Lachnoanaerobaculum sp. ICM7]